MNRALLGGILALGVAVGALGGIVVTSTACNLTPAQDASLVAQIEGAACQIADNVPNDPSYVPVICQILNSVTGTLTNLYVRVPKTQVSAFLAANPAPDGGIRGAAVWKGPGF